MSNDHNLLSDFQDMNWEQSRALIHTFLELLPDGVVLIDPQRPRSIIADCNTVYARMNGYEPEELIGQQLNLLKPIEPNISGVQTWSNDLSAEEANLPHIEVLRRSGTRRGHTVHRRKDDTLFTVEYHSSVISIGGRDFILGLDRDSVPHQHFEEIQKSEEALRAIFDASPDGIVLIDPTDDLHTIYECNRAYCRIYGYQRDELVGQPVTLLDATTQEIEAAGLELVSENKAGSAGDTIAIFKNVATSFNPVTWHKRKDGSIRAIEYSSTIVLIDGKKMVLGLDRDITQRRRDEHLDYDRNRVLELIATNAHFERSLAGIEQLIEHQLLGVNAALVILETPIIDTYTSLQAPAEKSTSPQPSSTKLHWRIVTEQIRSCLDEVALEESTLLRDALSHSRTFHLDEKRDASREQNGEDFRRESYCDDVLLKAFPNAQRCWLQPVIGSHGALGVLVLWSDSLPIAEESSGFQNETPESEDLVHRIAQIGLRLATIAIEQHLMSRRLAFQAERDLLTGLPNRYLFEDRLTHALTISHRQKTRLALMFLDLDGFKAVNDVWGHHCGDGVLQEVALRIQRCVRASDTVARLGGDEFTVVLSDMNHTRDAANVAKKIIAELRKPFVVEGQKTQITASIGIAFAPDDGDDLKHLMRSADSAMYRAKKSGKNRFERHHTNEQS